MEEITVDQYLVKALTYAFLINRPPIIYPFLDWESHINYLNKLIKELISPLII